MKDFCVDLDIAKELKEEGFLQFSFFNWFLNDNRHFIGTVDILDPFEESLRVCSAPTAEEILKEIPTEIFGCNLQIDKTSLGYYIWYLPIPPNIDKRPEGFCGHSNEKLSCALAKMWLYFKKEGHI